MKTLSEYRKNNQTILQEQHDDNYEPTSEEIEEYAMFIGIDPGKEPHLMWLAKEGIMKSLPTGWKPYAYYYIDSDPEVVDEVDDEISDDFQKSVINNSQDRTAQTLDGKNVEHVETLVTKPLVPADSNDILENKPHVNDIDALHNDDDERVIRANAAAQAAEKRLISATTKMQSTDNNLNDISNGLITSRTPNNYNSNIDLKKVKNASLEDKKLELLENNRLYVEKMKADFQTTKERDEKLLRNKMKADLSLIEVNIRDNIVRQKELLENRKQDELNQIKQDIEREKDELTQKLRRNMQTDINTEQQSSNNNNNQIQILQDQLTQEKHEYDEKDDLCFTLQRNIEKLRHENEILSQKIRKIEENHHSTRSLISSQQVQDKYSKQEKKELLRYNDSDDNDDDNLQQTIAHAEDDDLNLSDNDSDVISMERTLKELRTNKLESIKQLKISLISNQPEQELSLKNALDMDAIHSAKQLLSQHKTFKTQNKTIFNQTSITDNIHRETLSNTMTNVSTQLNDIVNNEQDESGNKTNYLNGIDLAKLPVKDVNSVLKNLCTINKNVNRMYDLIKQQQSPHHLFSPIPYEVAMATTSINHSINSVNLSSRVEKHWTSRPYSIPEYLRRDVPLAISLSDICTLTSSVQNNSRLQTLTSSPLIQTRLKNHRQYIEQSKFQTSLVTKKAILNAAKAVFDPSVIEKFEKS
ncbi:unnamed protein product [Didymodactylos carnosus]|uniref:WW domain-containing protein n=1 Tax=Didymodactylos carnosus TaxID=1234261 RepID=A0A8S2Q7R6_9BILA|nr:unnamed protein product [Didymodactylos carnosus]CAF4088922.1 unnamed protein product [Didymodactylos carnosus]